MTVLDFEMILHLQVWLHIDFFNPVNIDYSKELRTFKK